MQQANDERNDVVYYIDLVVDKSLEHYNKPPAKVVMTEGIYTQFKEEMSQMGRKTLVDASGEWYRGTKIEVTNEDLAELV